jgi:hypothetical protein
VVMYVAKRMVSTMSDRQILPPVPQSSMYIGTNAKKFHANPMQDFKTMLILATLELVVHMLTAIAAIPCAGPIFGSYGGRSNSGLSSRFEKI